MIKGAIIAGRGDVAVFHVFFALAKKRLFFTKTVDFHREGLIITSGLLFFVIAFAIAQGSMADGGSGFERRRIKMQNQLHKRLAPIPEDSSHCLFQNERYSDCCYS
ncbi:hypothetical protein JXA32_12010 [Candidatus Sumerlaeota bacterium]|nr:hypothetical protein [Candidatus Sumerlaeota bacterium]